MHVDMLNVGVPSLPAHLAGAFARAERQRKRAIKREQRHARYREQERDRVRAALKRLGLSTNINDQCWKDAGYV